jgi:defect in organelle trafficking protein DotC
MTEALRVALFTVLVLAGLASVRPSLAGEVSADTALTDLPVPPAPSSDEVDDAAHGLANPINIPVTGATITPRVGGGEAPPSLESLQAARPDVKLSDALTGPRAEALREAALSFGARGGLATRAFALNEMLRRYEARLDRTYDFHGLVVAVDGGQTLMRPPIVTEAELAFALADGSQTARETGHIYEITRQAQLASAPPNWRIYLVRTWVTPTPPPDALRPRTDEEVVHWDQWVAEGWAKGERQAVEIFLSDLSRLERDLIGMARYQVLLRAGLVEPPKLAFEHRPVEGGRDMMRIDDRTIRITDQPGLNANQRQWHPDLTRPVGGPIGAVP